MTTPKTKKAEGPRFAVGDYLADHHSIILRVEAVITDGPLPVYAIVAPNRGNELQWFTEYEITEERKLDKVEPDFAAYAKLEAGDVLRTGSSKHHDSSYATVLARVGHMVLLSNSPRSQHETETIEKVTAQLDELTGGAISAHGDVKKELRKGSSILHQSKIADRWWTTDQLCLQNWAIVSGE